MSFQTALVYRSIEKSKGYSFSEAIQYSIDEELEDEIRKNLSNFILVWDHNKQLCAFSKSFEQISGWNNEEIFESDFFSYSIHPEDYEFYDNSLIDILDNMECRIQEIKMRRKDGSWFWAEWRIMAVLKKPFKFLVAVCCDISVRKRLLNDLVFYHRLEAVNDMLPNLGHEFNNILAIIRGNIQALLLETSSSKGFVDTLRNMEEEVIRATALVDQIRHFVESPAEELVEHSPVKFIEDMLQVQNFVLKNENINVVRSYNSDKNILMYASSFLHAMSIIFHRAKRAVSFFESGIITISIFEDKGFLQISVEDNGKAFKSEQLNRIFKPYCAIDTEQAVTVLKENSELESTGVDMAIVKSIADTHGAIITVETGKVRGNIVSIRFPKEKVFIPRDKKIVVSSKNKVKKGKEKILIIDDEKAISNVLCRLIRLSGFSEPKEADSGDKALKIMLENRFDLIFLDWVLPDGNGDEVLKKIREIDPVVPVIIVSGKLGISDSEAIKIGASGLIKKPFDFNYVKNILDEFSFSGN